MRQTVAPRGNRVRELDLATINPGDVVHLRTASGSNFYFTRTSQSRVTATDVVGMFVQTDSRRFGQCMHHPAGFRVERMIRLHEELSVGSRGATGTVNEIHLNGELIS